MDIEQPIKSIAKGAELFILGIIISKIFGFLYRIVISKLGVEEYGTLSLGLAIMPFLVTISLIGLDFGILRYVSYYKEKNNKTAINKVIITASIVVITLSVIITLIVLLSGNLFGKFFNDKYAIPIIKLLSLILPLDVLRIVFFSSLKAVKKLKYEIIGKNIVESVSKVVITFILLNMGLGLKGATWGYIFSIMISFFFSLSYLRKNIGITFKKDLFKLDKEIIIYSFPLMLNVLIMLLIAYSGTIILGIYKTPTDIGIFNAALPLSNLMYLLPSALLILFIPLLTELYAKKEIDTLKRVYETITKWIITSNIIFISLFTLLAKDIIKITFGDSFINADIPLIILSIGNLFYFTSLVSNNLLIFLKKTKFIFWVAVMGGISNILLNLFFIQKLNIIGAALSTSFSQVIIYILLTYKTKGIIKNKIIKKDYLNILVAMILSFLITKPILSYIHNIYLKLIIGILMVLSIYFITLIFSSYIKKEEKILIKSIIHRIKKNKK